MKNPSKTAAVLGCGLVGASMARDLARGPSIRVLAADLSEKRLQSLAGVPGIAVRQVDLSDLEALRRLTDEADVVVGALPSKLGLGALRAVIDCGKPYCDISFMAEDATDLTDLTDLARVRGVTAVVDCGVAPGLANLIIGHCAAQLDETYDVVYYVGGLPRVRCRPYEYKAPFAPLDVIEEYTRPARLVQNGEVAQKPALSDLELIDFPEVGTLEAFNTDGLRSLVRSVRARNMVEKTLRYPGHADLMRVLRDTGFFSGAPIDVAGVQVAPLDLTAKLLFPHWQLGEQEEEFTLLDVRVTGRRGDRHVAYHYRMFDTYHAPTQTHSMARVTGYPCTIVARMLLEGSFERPGVHPPETLGAEAGLLDRMLQELAERDVRVVRVS